MAPAAARWRSQGQPSLLQGGDEGTSKRVRDEEVAVGSRGAGWLVGLARVELIHRQQARRCRLKEVVLDFVRTHILQQLNDAGGTTLLLCGCYTTRITRGVTQERYRQQSNIFSGA